MSNDFGSFSESDKRALFTYNLGELRAEMARRSGSIAPRDLTGARYNPLRRLSNPELTQLEEINELMLKADYAKGREAIALYKKVAELAPWDEICLLSIGVEYAESGDYDEAIRWLERAQTLNPSSKRVRSNLEAILSAANKQRGDQGDAAKLETRNLLRWRESNQPRMWVEAHKRNWNHDDWLSLLESLKQSEFWPMMPDAVGEVLEEFKRNAMG